MLRRRTLWKRLFVRLFGAAFLFVVSLPGLALWMPIFFISKLQSEKQKKTGPVFDTYDEVRCSCFCSFDREGGALTLREQVAQTKLVYGLISFLGVYFMALVFSALFLPITAIGIPVLMWLTLRWLEVSTTYAQTGKENRKRN